MSGTVVSSQSQASVESTDFHALPTFTTFLRDVPPQLTILLVELAPYITSIRRVGEAMSWRSEFSESWLLLGVWWTLCLLSEFTLRYFTLFIAAAFYVYLTIRPTSRSRPPVTEQSLQATVIDLTVIESLVPCLPRLKPLPLNVLARVLAIFYIPSLALTHFVRLRVLFAILGTLIITWRARWTVNIRQAVWRSAWFRHHLSRAWALISGQPSESVKLSTSSFLQSPETERCLRFLITIYENQRWWVGLDWTAALLPNERPSWCSASLEPVLPPSAFTLPPPTVTYMGDGKGGLVKKTASWTWGEGEWKVSVRKEPGLKRIEKDLPAPKEDNSQHANRIGKAKQKLYDTSQRLKTHREDDSKDVDDQGQEDPSAAEPNSRLQDLDPDEQLTDNDGWVYGDNTWGGFTSSGGLRKYTRFRKWTRIALLTEIIEPASAEEAHKHVAEQREGNNYAGREKEMTEQRIDRRSLDSRRQSLEEDDDGESNGLRNRLKSVIRRASLSSHS